MKKLFALMLMLCLVLTAAAVAEEEFDYYPDEYPESKVYVNTWVAEDGDWRIEMYAEDGGLRFPSAFITGRIPSLTIGMKPITRTETLFSPSTKTESSSGMT